MRRQYARIRKKKGSQSHSWSVKDILPNMLLNLEKKMGQNPQHITAAWTEVVGSSIASMTRAMSFDEGVLLVHVTHSTLYQLLVNYEKKRLLSLLRKKFPATEIRDIVFRIG